MLRGLLTKTYPMKFGSDAHKDLFCRSFIDSYLNYEPETMPWPELDDLYLERLRGIPFWQQALTTEQRAGKMVTAFAETIDDPTIRDAIALQGEEETRHGRLIAKLIRTYDVEVPDKPMNPLPERIDDGFKDFGFEECLDSFFAFGMFAIAREAQYFPESVFQIFDPILDEEARHIVFFVNWFTYLQVKRGPVANLLRPVSTLRHYSSALQNLISMFGSKDSNSTGFTAKGASSFTDNLTPEGFLATCLRENEHRMAKFDPELLRPTLIPALATLALRILQLRPKKKKAAPSLETSG